MKCEKDSHTHESDIFDLFSNFAGKMEKKSSKREKEKCYNRREYNLILFYDDEN